MPAKGAPLDARDGSFFTLGANARARPLIRNGLGLSALEQSAWVRERFELDRVPGRIAQEQRRLLPHLSDEADLGFDEELDAGRAQTLDQRAPALHRQHDPEVA